MQQLRSIRSTSSTLIHQYINDCRLIDDHLQINIQRIIEDIQTIFSTCNQSVGKVHINRIIEILSHIYLIWIFYYNFKINKNLIFFFEGQILTISKNLGQQIYILNEKVRAVLSLAFQNFHTIFEELNNVHNHFQVN